MNTRTRRKVSMTIAGSHPAAQILRDRFNDQKTFMLQHWHEQFPARVATTTTTHTIPAGATMFVELLEAFNDPEPDTVPICVLSKSLFDSA